MGGPFAIHGLVINRKGRGTEKEKKRKRKKNTSEEGRRKGRGKQKNSKRKEKEERVYLWSGGCFLNKWLSLRYCYGYRLFRLLHVRGFVQNNHFRCGHDAEL